MCGWLASLPSFSGSDWNVRVMNDGHRARYDTLKANVLVYVGMAIYDLG